ncbi:techylectin-5A-like [Palaemon carinicauda]|uniref:techylectin-5A-like n=1 Tax=Palaemon carinicauda TaxID=392227 RepID=UPI0035B5F0C4
MTTSSLEDTLHTDIFLSSAHALVPASNVSQSEGLNSRNCLELRQLGIDISDVYTIYPYDSAPEHPVEVFCDMKTDGGGWTIIQRRDDLQPREDFYRTLIEYELGFGNLRGEFWLGLNHIHALTDQTLNEIRFDLEDFEGESRYANYRTFYVHDKASEYLLEVNGYSGDAGNSFDYHNGQKFSTIDHDRDDWSGDCAVTYAGAWWYNNCHRCNLNGLYLSGAHESFADGIEWNAWHGLYYSLKRTEMKIRPAY